MPRLPWIDVGLAPLRAGKVVAIGKNYREHVLAMGDPSPSDRPLVFMKPTEAVAGPGDHLWYPPECSELHPEAELVLVIGRRLAEAGPEECLTAVTGWAAGLDMTDRGWQRLAKQRGWPWERAKSFDGSAAVGRLLPRSMVGDWMDLRIVLRQDGQVVQTVDPRSMIWKPGALLAAVSKVFTLMPGDLVFTGTPAGTQPVGPGSSLELELVGFSNDRFTISPNRPGLSPEHP